MGFSNSWTVNLQACAPACAHHESLFAFSKDLNAKPLLVEVTAEVAQHPVAFLQPELAYLRKSSAAQWLHGDC